MLQEYNPANEAIKIFVKDRLWNRADAKISVFDSVVQGGDAVWEGLRLYKEGILHLTAHLERLTDSAKALHFSDIPDFEFINAAIAETLEANAMHIDTHIRLTLTRGEKITSGMDPRLNQSGSCLIVLAEHKKLVYDRTKGITAISSSQRRNGPTYLDSKIHHNNLLNNILAKIQANVAGVDAAIMLDDRGFVAELNDTNLFLIKEGAVYTPYANACLPGISRKMTMQVADSLNIPCVEADLSLYDFYTSDFVFASGTMGELTPLTEIDGRKIGRGRQKGESLFSLILGKYQEVIPWYCERP
jgi:branched-chain amino acid aminotransferase